MSTGFLATIDWVIVGLYFLLTLIVGLVVSRKAGQNTTEFFLSGRNMTWWLLGISMVATTFAADTPNLVTGLVRDKGVAGNWGWWALLLTGMLTVFVYAKLWRRSQVMTDIEFYELRYSGKPAAFLRGFRALYLGFVFNVLVMGIVGLAAIKFGEIILGLPGWATLTIAGIITLLYSAIGGLRAVIMTDFVQFILAMVGSIWAAIYVVGHEKVGGLEKLLSHDLVLPKLDLFPTFDDPEIFIPVLLVPIAVQWWASYYPGAEPGGGGYVAQRMFSAKNERHAIGATLLFNVAHYALRPWPWILIALASLIVFPELSDIQAAFPQLTPDKLDNDVAYPAMLTLLPTGLLGLVSASLVAAYMSTMSTQLNLGASYLVNDFYQRFVKPEASQIELVWMGRLFTGICIVLAGLVALFLKGAVQGFNLIILLGAGTGLIYILRWFWWRINAYTEIIAMMASLFIALYLTLIHDATGLNQWLLDQGILGELCFQKDAAGQLLYTDSGHLSLVGWFKTVFGALTTTLIWIIATFVTPADDAATLRNFYRLIRPAGRGWQKVIDEAEAENEHMPNPQGKLPLEMACFLIGTISVYAALFATGNWLYGNSGTASFLTLLAGVGGFFLFRVWNQVKGE
ncbi:MAG: sodium:solute symporter family protein [Bacteroidota bacterium]